MAQCKEQPQYSCIGPGGSCDHLRGGCAHAKKQKEDEERDRKEAHGSKGGGRIGIWGWAVIIIVALYFFGR